MTILGTFLLVFSTFLTTINDPLRDGYDYYVINSDHVISGFSVDSYLDGSVSFYKIKVKDSLRGDFEGEVCFYSEAPLKVFKNYYFFFSASTPVDYSDTFSMDCYGLPTSKSGSAYVYETALYEGKKLIRLEPYHFSEPYFKNIISKYEVLSLFGETFILESLFEDMIKEAFIEDSIFKEERRKVEGHRKQI